VGNETRMGKLIELFIRNPLLFVTLDQSVNERFLNFFFPMIGFFTNFGIPHGFESFNEYMHEIISSGKYSNLINDYFFSKIKFTRIMSGISSIFFELGLIGLIPFIILWKNIKRIERTDPFILFIFFLYLIVLLNAINFANALVCFIFGNIIYVSKYPNSNVEN
jgi:hypothetical protein